MWRGVATQVRTHMTHGTQKIRRLRQDATPTDQTQGPFLLMYITIFYILIPILSEQTCVNRPVLHHV